MPMIQTILALLGVLACSVILFYRPRWLLRAALASAAVLLLAGGWDASAAEGFLSFFRWLRYSSGQRAFPGYFVRQYALGLGIALDNHAVYQQCFENSYYGRLVPAADVRR